jgi:lipopolysaccharide/colanic/teichoic acid biosynthesis glycosyltransferase
VEGQRIIASMRPGLTGIGSLVFRDEESLVERLNMPVDRCYREVLGPYKAELEAWYKNNQNIITYILIIFVTAWVIIFPKSEIYHRIWPSLPHLPVQLQEMNV